MLNPEKKTGEYPNRLFLIIGARKELLAKGLRLSRPNVLLYGRWGILEQMAERLANLFAKNTFRPASVIHLFAVCRKDQWRNSRDFS